MLPPFAYGEPGGPARLDEQGRKLERAVSSAIYCAAGAGWVILIAMDGLFSSVLWIRQ